MPRPTTKSDLLFAAKQNYEKLNLLISKMTEKELQTEFDFSEDKKKEAHWQRDKNLRDVLIHLYEWQQLLLMTPSRKYRDFSHGMDRPLLRGCDISSLYKRKVSQKSKI